MIAYFTYGSNLHLKRARERGVTIIKVERGILRGWKLEFTVTNDIHPKAGFANIQPDEGSHVEGAILYTDSPSITALDEYEDYPIDYLKEEVSVENENGQIVKCMAYVGNKKRMRANLKPTKTYLNHILEGKAFFSHPYYEKLKNTGVIDLGAGTEPSNKY